MSLLSYSAFPSQSSGKQRDIGVNTHQHQNHHSTDGELDVDADTSALIAKLALEDLEAVYGRRLGKSRVGGPLSDEDYAYQLQVAQYQEMLKIAEDAKIAKSHREAVATDFAYVEALQIAEAAAAEDRQAALALSRGEPLPEKTANQIRLENPAFVVHPAEAAQAPTSSPISAKAASKSKATTNATSAVDLSSLFDFDSFVIDKGESNRLASEFQFDTSNQNAIAGKGVINKSFGSTSTSAGPSIDRSQSVKVGCTICGDNVRSSSALRTPCSHYYCLACLKNLVELFTRDESLYPLRCCQDPIPIATVTPHLSAALRRLFEAKNTEYSVLSKDRVYCCNPICSAFLGSSEGRDVEPEVICIIATCRTSTCPRCKQAGHPEDPDCKINKATIEVRALARQEGWQTCPGCHTLVELDLGCNHMTCRCRTEFCYVCAVPWKGCTCAQWDEQRLLVTAQQRVENEVGNDLAAIAPAVIQRRVQQRVETLRVNHHCARHNWTYRQGGGRCEECHFKLPSYLLICRGCSLLACPKIEERYIQDDHERTVKNHRGTKVCKEASNNPEELIQMDEGQ